MRLDSRAALALCLLAVAATAHARSSSPLVLSPDGTLLAAVNPDSDSVTLLRAATLERLGEVKVGRDPRGACFASDGRTLAVSNRGSDDVSVVDAADLRETRRIAGFGAPHGVVCDGTRVLVAESARSRVSAADLATGSVTARAAVEPHPTGLALAPRGRLLVTHFFTGRLSVLDARRLTTLGVVGAPSDANLSRHVAVSPDGRRAYLPLTFSDSDASPRGFDTTVLPAVTVADLDALAPLPRERVHLATPRRAVNLPGAAAISADGRLLYVAAEGTDDVTVVELPNGRLLAHIDVGAAPSGLALSRDGTRLYALNSLDGTVTAVRAVPRTAGLETPLYDLSFHRPIVPGGRRGGLTCASCHAGPDVAVRVGEGDRLEFVSPPWTAVATSETTRIPLPERVLRGKKVFTSAARPELSAQRWVSCASCHPDGGMDARTWADFPDGPRNTPALFGAVETFPLHWSGDLDELQDVEITIRRVHFGRGLVGGPERAPGGDPYANSSPDLDALAAYVASLRAPAPPPTDARLSARGAEVFAARGCVSCHPGPLYTDRRTHDVGTGASPRERKGPRFDTPSLRSAWLTAPYLHDGSAATLEDVLKGRGEHGVWDGLGADERAALVEYLRSL